MTSDIERIRRDHKLSDVAQQMGVQLTRDGDEWAACCPFHAEKTPSFTIFTGKDHVQRMHCFGCDAKGDVLDFVELIKGVDKREAMRILGGGKSGPNVTPKQVEVRDIYAGIEPCDPPLTATIGATQRVVLYNPKRAGTERERGSFIPSMVFPYRRANGSLIGYVLRHDLPDGGKETPMVMWVRLPNGKHMWARFPFPKPRPLYGIETLKAGQQVIIVEGEKCRDKLASASGRAVISWPGGINGVDHVDWSPLQGRDVIIWRDADPSGQQAQDRIAATLAALGCKVRVLHLPDDKPKGWDCADAIDVDGWSKDDLDAFMRRTVGPWTPPAPPAERASSRFNPPAGVTQLPARTVEARTTQQEQPQSATVTQLHTRKTVAANNYWMEDLVTNAEGKTKPNVSKNWSLFLENDPATAGLYSFDAFKGRIMLMRAPPWERGASHWEPREITDRDYSETIMWLEARHLTPKISNIKPVIHTVAERASFDRLREYLEGLKWDREPRVKNWLTYYMGADDTEYTRVIGLRWLVSAVARGLQPGCKMDTMPILEGPQGARKSTGLRRLYGDEFFSDDLADIGSKDAAMQIRGVWGLEVAEMHKMSAADTNEVKKFLGKQSDRYRPPYGQAVIDVPRRIVFNGTINPEGNPYLKDPTGARRFWPIVVGSIDTDGIAEDRDQLWAEAVELFRAGTPWWVQEEEQEAVEAQQSDRTDIDIWSEPIMRLLQGQKTVTQMTILNTLGIQTKDAEARHAARIGRVMQKLGWEQDRETRDGERVVVFRNPKFAGQGEMW